MSGQPLQVTAGIVIPAEELTWRFHTTGGPGGQHANRSHTGVELEFDIIASAAFDDETRGRILAGLGKRVRDGLVVVGANDSRSQWRNRQTARRRLADLLRAAVVDETPRTPTRPSPAARRRRVEAKRARSALKRLRRPPEPE
jgi:ribosome-associated protein